MVYICKAFAAKYLQKSFYGKKLAVKLLYSWNLWLCALAANSPCKESAQK